MNIIILGAGKVGSYLTSDLAEDDHDILVIDHDKDVLDKLIAANDIMGIVGDGRDPEVLIDANAANCDLFIAISLSDDVNLIASTMAKKMGAKNIIIRLRDPYYIKHREIIEEITSATMIVNPESIAAKDIQRALKYSHALNVEGFFRDQAIMMEIVIGEGSSLAGSRISDLNAYSANYHTLIGIVNNNGRISIPHGSYVLEKGEKIYVIGEREGVDRFYKQEALDRYKIKNVLIIGAGAITEHLTELLLDRGFSVTVVEIDKEVEESINRYILVYIFLFIIFMLVVTLDTNNFEAAFSAVATTYNNVGPGLIDFGPITSFAAMSKLSKLTLSFAMLFGRLELYPMILLFARDTYSNVRK
ncbi:NAD-binding protein [Anaerococcus tetradius]|uniref:NAD-binding protein n=1 Tax=Anaerococcus tetradius TaxID=33036 RepID=UPI0023F4655A|nr:NAD-binding protein [Anaerococcus tetradius]